MVEGWSWFSLTGTCKMSSVTFKETPSNWCHIQLLSSSCCPWWQRTNVESVRILGYWWKFSLQNDNPYLFDMMKTKCNIRKEKTIDLFAQRIMEPQSFTYCGLDLFGPFCIMEKRSEIKIMLCYVHMYG